MTYTYNGCPSEDDEENAVADYCDLRGWKHTHIGNEIFTESWKQKAKQKYLGLHSGFPDHVVLVKHKDGRTIPVFLEMKRKKGGEISDNQFDWVEALREAGQHAIVCEGAEQAIKVLEAVAGGDEEPYKLCIEKFYKKYEKNRQKREKAKNSCPF